MANDKELIARYLGGDDSAFSELIDLYLKPVYNFLFRFTGDSAATDDLVQDTFIKVWKNFKRFDRTKSFKTWLFTIAKNTAYDYLKKKRSIPFSNFTDEDGNNSLDNVDSNEILPDEILKRKDLAQNLEEKLNQLPQRYALILTLHYKDDFALGEISQILTLPYNTVKSQHARALASLKKLLLENASKE